MFKNIPIKTMDNNQEEKFDHEQLISIVHRLMDERDILRRENEYLRAKLNESVLIETINEIRKERDLLLKLLLNLSTNQKDEPISNHYTDDQ
jgi:transcriptional regulator CtsR